MQDFKICEICFTWLWILIPHIQLSKQCQGDILHQSEMQVPINFQYFIPWEKIPQIEKKINTRYHDYRNLWYSKFFAFIFLLQTIYIAWISWLTMVPLRAGMGGSVSPSSSDSRASPDIDTAFTRFWSVCLTSGT